MAHSHNIHILLGKNAEQNISHIKEYVIKYGEEHVDEKGRNASEFLQLLIFKEDGLLYSAEKKIPPQGIFTSGIEDEYLTELVKCPEMLENLNDEGLRYFFKKKFSQTVTVQNPGDNNLHVCIHVPIFDNEYFEQAERIMAAINANNNAYTVDLLLIAPDLAYLYIEDQSTLSQKNTEYKKNGKEILEKFVNIKTTNKYKYLNSIILISNENEGGISLNLNQESFANIIGEYALATTSYYSQIFMPAFLMETANERPVIGLGISMLHLDRFHFVQYMLHRSYSYIMDREGINEEGFAANRIASKARDILEGNINIFKTIFDDDVKPRLEQGIPQETIRSEIEEIIKKKIEALNDRILEHIKDEGTSLPEKRVVLAQMLGEDDTLIEGEVVDGEFQPIVDDCRQEVLDIYIKTNNKLASTDKELKDSSGTRSIASYAILSNGTDRQIETAKSKLAGIKEIRDKIRKNANYIRRTEKDLIKLQDSIKTRQDSNKRLTENGFEFDGRTYYLMPKNIEVPLDETFIPDSINLPEEVDLRQQFTPIKDQGALGACSAFALVSIYEYILKKNGHKDTCLSELFSYQNARIRQGKSKEEGTSLYDNIMGMGEKGICLNEIFPYVPDINRLPDEAAYDDAQKRKITKALNVEKNISHIKSAISQGYPVAISLSLYESFKSETSGFVPHPGNEEFVGYHAMVICGYSEKDKIFIVRNSWGETFGDKGYCYIPYSYIGNTNFLHQACIITEISVAQIKVEGVVGNTPISFNESDSEVLAARLQIRLEEAKIALDKETEKLKGLREDYMDMITKVNTPETKETLRKGADELLRIEIAELERNRQDLIKERSEKKTIQQKNEKRIWFFLGIVSLPILLVFSLLAVYIKNEIFTEYLYSWGILNCFQILGIVLLCSTPFISKKLKSDIPDDLQPEFSSSSWKAFKLWIIGVLAVVILYLFLVIYKIMPSPFSLGHIWLIILTLLTYVPFTCMTVIYYNVGKMIENLYKEKQRSVDAKKLAKENEKKNLKTYMFITGKILEKTTEFITRLNDKYSLMISYVNNLKTWYKENAAIVDVPPPDKAPFISLTNEESLINYFISHAEELTKEIKLHELLNEYKDLADDSIISIKNAIKDRISSTLFNKISDFSIFDHITKRREFDYVSNEHVDIDELLKTMDVNSRIFVRVSGRVMDDNAQNATCKMLFREAPDNQGARMWNEYVNENFQTKPITRDIMSRYKIFIIRLEGLATKEIDLLRTV